MWLTVM